MCVLLFFKANYLVETHVSALVRQFGRDKTLALVQSNFYWPKLKRDVDRHVKQSRICHLEKIRSQNSALYTPLLVLKVPWEDFSLDFAMGFPRKQRNKNSIMVVVNRFSKMSYFVPYNKTNDASHMAKLYFKKTIELHGIPRSMVSDRNSKFLSHFWRILWMKLGTSLNYSTSPSSSNRWTNGGN